MSTGKLKNMKLMVSHFWGEKRPTKKSEDCIPTMLGPASCISFQCNAIHLNLLTLIKLGSSEAKEYITAITM